MAITILKAQIPLNNIDTFLESTIINNILSVNYLEGGYLLILYN